MDGPFWGSVTSKNFLIDSKTEIWKGQQKVSEAAVNSSSDHATSHSQHGASENIYIYIFFSKGNCNMLFCHLSKNITDAIFSIKNWPKTILCSNKCWISLILVWIWIMIIYIYQKNCWFNQGFFPVCRVERPRLPSR